MGQVRRSGQQHVGKRQGCSQGCLAPRDWPERCGYASDERIKPFGLKSILAADLQRWETGPGQYVPGLSTLYRKNLALRDVRHRRRVVANVFYGASGRVGCARK